MQEMMEGASQRIVQAFEAEGRKKDSYGRGAGGLEYRPHGADWPLRSRASSGCRCRKRFGNLGCPPRPFAGLLRAARYVHLVPFTMLKKWTPVFAILLFLACGRAAMAETSASDAELFDRVVRDFQRLCPENSPEDNARLFKDNPRYPKRGDSKAPGEDWVRDLALKNAYGRDVTIRSSPNRCQFPIFPNTLHLFNDLRHRIEALGVTASGTFRQEVLAEGIVYRTPQWDSETHIQELRVYRWPKGELKDVVVGFYRVKRTDEAPTADKAASDKKALQALVKATKFYNLFFENATRGRVEVAVRYRDTEDQWHTKGWVVLEPGVGERIVATKNAVVYVHARQSGGSWDWGGRGDLSGECKKYWVNGELLRIPTGWQIEAFVAGD